MNINNWSPRKKIIALLGIVAIIIGIVITIFLVQRQQELRSRAQQATVLTLTPPNQNVAPGDSAQLNLNINPGVNQVNFVKFTIKFDPDQFDSSKVVFNADPNSPLKITGGPTVVSSGEVSWTLDVGSDPTKVIQENTVLGQIILPANKDAVAGGYQVSFDESKTQVRSIGATDAFNENVLSSTTLATVTITSVCKPNIATCSWDPSPGATSYHYVITRLFADAKPGEPTWAPYIDATTEDTQVEFDSVPGQTYRCEVTAVNECGSATPGEATSSCPTPSPTPVPSATPIPSASPTPGPSSTPTPVPSASPTPIPSATPTPIPGSSPTPTTPAGASPTPTTTQIATVITATPTSEVPTTPVPTLPPTGNPFVIGGVLGGILFVLGGLALLLL